MSYLFITESEGKLREARRILQREVAHQPLPLPELQNIFVEKVVQTKLLAAYQTVQQPVMVEDTGLYFTAWNGLPGALIKWFMQSVGNDGLCQMLNHQPDRTAYAETIIGIYDGRTEPQFFTGRTDGTIASQPRGENGFGWDKIFIPTGNPYTFAELSDADKDQYSMRRKALEQLAVHLENLG